MIYYSFFTDWRKTSGSLVFRTNEGQSEFQVDLKLFKDKDEAQADFFSLLYDNEDYRINEYVDTEKGKNKPRVKKLTTQKPLVVYEPRPDINFEINKIYNEKCEETMTRMPNLFVDYTMTSPPYNVGKGTRNDGTDGLYGEYEDDLTDEQYEEWLFSVINELLRVTRRHIFLNIQMLGKNKKTVLNLLGTYRHKIKDLAMWNKAIAPPHIQPGVMNSKFEFIIILSNDKPESKKFDDGNFKGNFNNVIEGMNASMNKYSELNKATFPLYLPRTFMVKFGKEGDLWYDPFSGTGTTWTGAVIEKKNFIGSELSKEQCYATSERVANEIMKMKFEFVEAPKKIIEAKQIGLLLVIEK